MKGKCRSTKSEHQEKGFKQFSRTFKGHPHLQTKHRLIVMAHYKETGKCHLQRLLEGVLGKECRKRRLKEHLISGILTQSTVCQMFIRISFPIQLNVCI